MARHKPHRYDLGEEALIDDIREHIEEADAKYLASKLQEGDGAFIIRSDKKWRYCKVIEVAESYIDFEVSSEGCTKKVGRSHWVDRVRVLKREMGQWGQRSSTKTEATYPFSSQSSMEFDASDAGGGHTGETSVRRSFKKKDKKSTPSSRKEARGKNPAFLRKGSSLTVPEDANPEALGEENEIEIPVSIGGRGEKTGAHRAKKSKKPNFDRMETFMTVEPDRYAATSQISSSHCDDDFFRSSSGRGSNKGGSSPMKSEKPPANLRASNMTIPGDGCDISDASSIDSDFSFGRVEGKEESSEQVDKKTSEHADRREQLSETRLTISGLFKSVMVSENVKDAVYEKAGELDASTKFSSAMVVRHAKPHYRRASIDNTSPKIVKPGMNRRSSADDAPEGRKPNRRVGSDKKGLTASSNFRMAFANLMTEHD